MKIGFIGAGKVGVTLGRFFSDNGLEVSGYYSKDPVSAKEAADLVCSRCYDTLAEILECSDILFLTVPDSAITQVYEKLAALGILGKQLVHCSGAMSAEEAFPSIKDLGAKGVSLHPLFPVSSKYESYKVIGKAFFCIEGDKECADEWCRRLGDMGCRTRMITEDVKSRYHLACAAASNLVCGLIYESTSLLKDCGFTEEEALTALKPLIISNIERTLEVGAVNALTGPVERNDVSTVQKHIECLEDPDEQEMYKAVSRRLAKMAEIRHPDNDFTEMKKILE